MRVSNQKSGGPSRGRRHVERAGPYSIPQARTLPPPCRTDTPVPGGWGSYARSLVVTPIKAAVGYTGSWFGRESSSDGKGDTAGDEQSHSGDNSISLVQTGHQNGEVSSGQRQRQLSTPNGPNVPVVPSSQSQIAAITSRDAHDIDTAISAARTVQPTLHISPNQQITAAKASRADPRDVKFSLDDAGNSPPSTFDDALLTPRGPVDTGSLPTAVTPFDTVLSLLDRIKQRPHTPWQSSAATAAASRDGGIDGRPKSYSPVQFQGNSLNQSPRTSMYTPRLSPLGSSARGYLRPSRLAHTFAQPASPGGLLAQQNSSGDPVGTPLFLGQPQDGERRSQPPPLQSSSIFTHAAGTPLPSTRFARRLNGFNGMSLTPQTLATSAMASRTTFSSTATPRVPEPPASAAGTPKFAAAVAKMSLPSPSLVVTGSKRGRADEEDSLDASAATPLLGSGYDAEACGTRKRQRAAVVERRTWQSASPGVFLQSRQAPVRQQLPALDGPPASGSGDDSSTVSTNAARRILMALETMSSPAQKDRAEGLAPPPPTASLGPFSLGLNAEGRQASSAAAIAVGKKPGGEAESRQPEAKAQISPLPLTFFPPVTDKGENECEAVPEAQTLQEPAALTAPSSTPAASEPKPTPSASGWGDLLSKNKEQEAKATAAVQAEIEKNKSAAQPSLPASSFGVATPTVSTPQQPAHPEKALPEDATPFSAPPPTSDKAIKSSRTTLTDAPAAQPKGRVFKFATKEAKEKSQKVSAVLAMVPPSKKATPDPNRRFRFGLPLEERSDSATDDDDAASPQIKQIKKIKAGVSANSEAAVAARIPLPDDEATQVPKADQGPSKQTDAAAAQPSGLLNFLEKLPLTSSTPGFSFGSQPQSATAASTLQAGSSSSALSAANGLTGFGAAVAKPAATLAAPTLPESQPSTTASPFQIGAQSGSPFALGTPAASLPSTTPLFGAGSPSPSAFGIPAATSAPVSTTPATATADSSAATSSLVSGVPASPPTFAFGNNTAADPSKAVANLGTSLFGAGGAPAFGAAFTSATGLAGASGTATASLGAGPASSVALPASLQLPSAFEASSSAGAGIATQPTDTAKPLMFGAPISSPLTFAFGTPNPSTQSANGGPSDGLTRQNSTGANSNMSTMSADEKPGGSWQPDGAASSFAAFGAASGFAFGQSASTPAFSSTAPSTAALAFGLGPPQHTAAPLAAPASAPALGFGFGSSSNGGFSSGAPSAASPATSSFGNGSNGGGFGGAAPSFSFGTTSSSTTGFAFGSTQLGAGGQSQPAAVGFGGALAPAPSLTTTQVGVMPGSQPQQPGQFMGGGGGGGMTLGGAPDVAATRPAVRKMIRVKRSNRK